MNDAEGKTARQRRDVLLESYLAGELTAHEAGELARLLEGDPQGLDRLVELLGLDEGLREALAPHASAESLARGVIERLRHSGQTDAFAAKVVERVRTNRRPLAARRRGVPWTPILIALGLMLTALVLVFLARSGPDRQDTAARGGVLRPAPEPEAPKPSVPDPKVERPEPPVKPPQVVKEYPPVAVPHPKEEIRPRIEEDPPRAEAPVEPPPAPEKPADAPKPAPEVRRTVTLAAILERAEGEICATAPGGSAPLSERQGLAAGEGIQTIDPESRATLRFPDSTRLVLGPQTTVRELWDRGGKRVVLSQGILTAEVAKQPPAEPMVLVTPHGEARVLGTSLTLVVDPDEPSDSAQGKKGSTRLEVREGRVRLTRRADGASVEVAADHFAVAARGIALAPKPLTPQAKGNDLTEQTYVRWRDFIAPKPQELRWQQIPWRPSLAQGIAESQEKDKPLLFWTMNGHPLGYC